MPAILLLLSYFSATASAQQSVVLQLKWKHNFQFAGFYAAQTQGYFADEGLNVDIREANPAKSPLQSVIDGEAQFGVSDSSLVLARLQGKKPVVIAAVFQSSPLVLATLKSRELVSPLDLKNKRVMYVKDADDAALQAMFAEFSITPDDITHVPHSFNNQDLSNGHVDAISIYSTSQPFDFADAGIDINLIAPSSYGIDLYGDLIFVEESYFRANSQQVLAFRRATLKGWQYALNNPQEMAVWIHNNLTPDTSIESLLYEAQMTEKMIRADAIELGYFSQNRLLRIAEVYKKTGKAPEASTLQGIHYLDHINQPIISDEWLRAGSAALLIISLFSSFHYFNNRRLRARVKEKTQELSRINGAMQDYLRVINQWVHACVLSPDLDFILVSKALANLTQYAPDELINTPFRNLLTNPECQQFQQMKAAIQDNRLWSGELQIHDKFGTNSWLSITIQPDFRVDEVEDGIALVATDISDKKRVEHLSRTDSLTGLSNRRHFDEVIEREVLRCRRDRSPMSLIMLDVDFFKQYNDAYGHLEGDHCLQKIAALIRLCAKRPADLAARFGGEEFVALLPGSDLQGANSVALTLEKKIRTVQLEHKASSIAPFITVSIGVACFDAETMTSADELIEQADLRMYNAKSNGRNQICCPGVLHPVPNAPDKSGS
ncbi:hypothetical protein A3759_05965 [Thalassolituus sp. HI0120]|jgi:diguanylate cyclase (GGDEF)-like protein/PAS domain S-box-containing protein|nr:hypothetical protein A3759_05965 [Thalassolituus sp. HI0120]